MISAAPAISAPALATNRKPHIATTGIIQRSSADSPSDSRPALSSASQGRAVHVFQSLDDERRLTGGPVQDRSPGPESRLPERVRQEFVQRHPHDFSFLPEDQRQLGGKFSQHLAAGAAGRRVLPV